VVGASAPGVAPPVGYIQRIREICEKHGILLIGDEIMSGVGRTGKFLASHHYQAMPQIICLSKGISSGYAPLGAVLVDEDIYKVIRESAGHSFIHGHTFGGNPVSAAVGLEVIRTIRDEGLMDHVADIGNYWFSQLKKFKETHKIVGDVRGKGLLLGIEFVRDNTKGSEPFDPTQNIRGKVFAECMERGLYVYPGGYSAEGVAGDHILLAPPFIVTESDVDEMTRILDESIQAIEWKFC